MQSGGGLGGSATGGRDASGDASIPDAQVDAQVAHASCVGNESMTICDVAELRVCSAAGASVRSETCVSAGHCQAGLASGRCAPCVEGDFRCDGAVLDHCVDNAFVTLKTCDTVPLCNETAGDCTTAGCLADQYVCQGDVLKQCNDSQTELVDVDTCTAGLCDQPGKQCDVCSAGARDCDNNQVRTCSANGQTQALAPCPSLTPRCIGQGNCVECTSNTHCSPGYCESNECVGCRNADDCTAGTCRAPTCDDGACGTSITEGAECGNGNVCTSSGECTQCRDDSDCVARGGGTPYCAGNSTCVACRSPSDCPTAACRAATCNSGACGQTILTSGMCDVGRVCNLSGVCELSCGNSRYDVGVEECDASSTQHTQYSCDPQCISRTIWTTCANGGGCIAPSHCVVSFGEENAFCSPTCDPLVASPPECNQLLPSAAAEGSGQCFAGDCFIQCMADWECPTTMRCDAGGACVSR